MAKIRYILVVLLFTAVGTLCRMQAAQHTDSFGGETFLIQRTAAHDCDARNFCRHSIFAPEVQCETHAQFHDQKTPVKSIAVSYHSRVATHLASGILSLQTDAPHPASKEYYIFSLGKIRI